MYVRTYVRDGCSRVPTCAAPPTGSRIRSAQASRPGNEPTSVYNIYMYLCQRRVRMLLHMYRKVTGKLSPLYTTTIHTCRHAHVHVYT